MVPHLVIDLSERWDRIPDGVWRSLRFTVTRPRDAVGAIDIPANGVSGQAAEVNTDLLSQNLRLWPGDSVSLTVHVRFPTTGAFNTDLLAVQAIPVGGADRDAFVQPLPAHPFRVVPDLGRVLDVALTRICGYDDAVKVEVVVRNAGTQDLADVVLDFEPPAAVRAGPLRRCQGRIGPGNDIRFDLVVAGGTIDLAVAATLGGERVTDRRTLAVPAAERAGAGARPFFSFLEPRALTTDRVSLVREDKGVELPGPGGVFPVRGGRTRYVLTVFPTHPQATRVRLFAAAGQVEVEPLTPAGREWPFRVTVVENPMLTQLVRLDYDVQVPGVPLRGELYLSIRPTAWRHWTFALTAGVAITAKGVTAVGPALVRDDGLDGVAVHVGDLLGKQWFDLVQVLSIPVIWGALWVTDRVGRTVQEV